MHTVIPKWLPVIQSPRVILTVDLFEKKDNLRISFLMTMIYYMVLSSHIFVLLKCTMRNIKDTANNRKRSIPPKDKCSSIRQFYWIYIENVITQWYYLVFKLLNYRSIYSGISCIYEKSLILPWCHFRPSVNQLIKLASNPLTTRHRFQYVLINAAYLHVSFHLNWYIITNNYIDFNNK